MRQVFNDFEIARLSRLLTAKQAAELLQISLQRLYEAVRLKLIPCVRIGKQIRFDEDALREWITRGGSTYHQEETDC
jgi:excisionase family DNA binding protein